MDLQTKTLNEFKETFNYPSLQKMSDMTGINLTRIFRLQNGTAMRLSEYETFHELILKSNQNNEEKSLSDKFFEFQKKMSKKAKQELIVHMTRKINHKDLLSGPHHSMINDLIS